jgi:hypothetical protein
MEGMTISATLTPEDYLKAQRLQLRRLLLRSTVVAWMVFAIVPALTIYCVWQLISPPPEGIQWVAFLILGMAALLPLFYWILLPRQIHRAFAMQEWLKEPKEFRIEAERISIRSGGRTYTRAWKDFQKFEAHEDMVFLYESARNYHIFPRHWFAPEEYAEFREILAKNISAPAAPAR